MEVSKYEYTMQLLAAMASINIAREQKISRTKAFFRFMKSQTAAMLSMKVQICGWMDLIILLRNIEENVWQKQLGKNEVGDHLIFYEKVKNSDMIG